MFTRESKRLKEFKFILKFCHLKYITYGQNHFSYGDQIQGGVY